MKLWGTSRVVNELTAKASQTVHFIPQVGPNGGKPSTGYAVFSTLHWHTTTVILLDKIQALINDHKMYEIIQAAREFNTTTRTSISLYEEISANDPLLLLSDDDDSENDSKGKSL